MATTSVTTCDECGDEIKKWKHCVNLLFHNGSGECIEPDFCCFDCLHVWVARYEDTGVVKGIKSSFEREAMVEADRVVGDLRDIGVDVGNTMLDALEKCLDDESFVEELSNAIYPGLRDKLTS